MNEERLSQLNRGRTADYLLNNLEPEFSEIEKMVLSKMKIMYRDGSFNESKLIACIAELCTLDDIRDRLSGQILTANHIQKELGE